jgi:stress-induced-phosphoprotein 1
MALMGAAYIGLQDHYNAKRAYEEALAEHENPSYRTSLSYAEAMIRAKESIQCYSPEISEEEKQQGNLLFRSGDFCAAAKHYTEAIKRDPDEAKLYSLRAACYNKLSSFDLALNDCDMCIAMNPTYAMAYVRKATALLRTGETSKAMAACKKALKLEPNCAAAIESFKACANQSKSDQEESRSGRNASKRKTVPRFSKVDKVLLDELIIGHDNEGVIFNNSASPLIQQQKAR